MEKGRDFFCLSESQVITHWYWEKQFLLGPVGETTPLPWRSVVDEIGSLQPCPAVWECFHGGVDNSRTISSVSLRAVWHWFFHCFLKEDSPEPEREGNTDPSPAFAAADMESSDFSLFTLTQRQARKKLLLFHREGHYFELVHGHCVSVYSLCLVLIPISFMLRIELAHNSC